MAKRPVFCPNKNKIGVRTIYIDFQWHAGFSIVQKQKSIHELHSAASKLGISNILEISSKSVNNAGVALSAFNLSFVTKKYKTALTVETAFQGSKVFEKGGPYIDLLGLDSRAAKKDERLKTSGALKYFQFFSLTFPLSPRTYFYDWLYINALAQSEYLDKLQTYDGFTDIEFNPSKSINCQAHSAALFVNLRDNQLLEYALRSPEEFLEITEHYYQSEDYGLSIRFHKDDQIGPVYNDAAVTTQGLWE